MSLIGIINSDPDIRSKIERAFPGGDGQKFHLRFLNKDHSISEFLNYDLPELIVINLSDPAIDVDEIMLHVRKDSWLHNFGMIGLFDRHDVSEETLLNRLNDINILSLIDFTKISSHLKRSCDIIDRNKQIIFQMDLVNKLVDKGTGSFSVSNDPLAASVYAGLAATSLAQRGFVGPQKKVALQVCLTELLLNGIEHGNCKIDYEEKFRWLAEGHSIFELVAKKCEDPKVAAKRVFFEWEIGTEITKFTIRDEGDGFDVSSWLAKLSDRKGEGFNGRGILMARKLASKLAYNQKGNMVTMMFTHDHPHGRKVPAGFSDEESLNVKRGEIVFEQGEPSDFLYYISSGTYSVYHEDEIVGKLTPADIFVGEMSFLLNNKRSATVVADKNGKLLRISRKSFVSVVKDYPHYGIFLSKLLARKLVRSNTEQAALKKDQVQ